MGYSYTGPEFGAVLIQNYTHRVYCWIDPEFIALNTEFIAILIPSLQPHGPRVSSCTDAEFVRLKIKGLLLLCSRVLSPITPSLWL